MRFIKAVSLPALLGNSCSSWEVFMSKRPCTGARREQRHNGLCFSSLKTWGPSFRLSLGARLTHFSVLLSAVGNCQSVK